MNNKTDMTKTKNKLPDTTNHFLTNLSDYLQTPLYFYGSIQRYDYYHGHSDIDIDIFTPNEKSTINTLSNYLQIDKKKLIKKCQKNAKMIYWRIQTNIYQRRLSQLSTLRTPKTYKTIKK